MEKEERDALEREARTRPKAEEEKWKKKYPNVAKKITDLEQRVKHLENLHMNDLK